MQLCVLMGVCVCVSCVCVRRAATKVCYVKNCFHTGWSVAAHILVLACTHTFKCMYDCTIALQHANYLAQYPLRILGACISAFEWFWDSCNFACTYEWVCVHMSPVWELGGRQQECVTSETAFTLVDPLLLLHWCSCAHICLEVCVTGSDKWTILSKIQLYIHIRDMIQTL